MVDIEAFRARSIQPRPASFDAVAPEGMGRRLKSANAQLAVARLPHPSWSPRAEGPVDREYYPLTVYPLRIYIGPMTSDPADLGALLPLPPATFHILLALAAGDRHGYGIIQDVEARTNAAPPVRRGGAAGRSPPPHAAGPPRQGRGVPDAGTDMIGLYRRLLHLYPASFRREYGDEMCAIFAERSAGAGALARVGLLLGAVMDIVANAIAVHWDVLIEDLRYTLRSLNRSRGFACAAIGVVAIGVGANTAAFSVADFVLLRPLPRRRRC